MQHKQGIQLCLQATFLKISGYVLGVIVMTQNY